MKHSNDYIDDIKTYIISESHITDFSILREESQGKIGLYRYRILFDDKSLLEMFERFDVTDGKVTISKYSFHWQDADGKLIKRWDNAAHHPELSSHPHHIHEGAEENVMPHLPVTAKDILHIILSSLQHSGIGR
jgi:hypothetical protein